MSGTLIGPAFGPFLGGTIVTFKSWRFIFWLQTALGGFVAASVLIGLPETIHKRRYEELKGLSRKKQAHQLWNLMNPVRAIRLFRYPNLLLAVRY
jgi:MFS family permease